MNRRQKEIQKLFLDDENNVLKKIEQNYQTALADINYEIERLLARDDANLQNVIYQIEYQKMLKSQVETILENLHNNEFRTVSEYLTKSYEDGFIGTMYDLQGQGVPLVIPIDQRQVVTALFHETKLSESLYNALGKDTKELSKRIASEISRGITNGSTYNEIAMNIANLSKIPKNNAMRIARTEAHRIQCKATADAQWKAKAKGADVVKQWDSSLDGKTRDTHRQLDGQIRELGEPFEVEGKEAMEPGGFGRPEEDCNCRCALLSRARWALGNDFTKWDQETGGLVKIKADEYDDFKRKYEKKSESVRSNVQKMNPLENNGKSSTIFLRNMSNVSTGGKRNEVPLSENEVAKCIKYARKLGFSSDIAYSNYSNTAFVGSIEGDRYCRLVIGTDVKPIEGTLKEYTANQLVSIKGALAHEIVGHYEAWLGGFECDITSVDEAQASIRAARFAEGLSKEERYMLIRDALGRLNADGIKLYEARKMMRIERR